ncbi:MAG: PEP-CTERM sorting domain-containing protein [Verrucomicrobiota bacterium]
MKVIALLLCLFTAILPVRAGTVISSAQRLDPGAGAVSVTSSPNTFKLFTQVWRDYTFTFRTTPSYLVGADMVMTHYFTDSADPDFQLRLTLAVPATVFLLIDDRVPDVATGMPWVASLGFTDTGDEAAIQIAGDSLLTTSSIYSARFPAGEVVLLQQNSMPGNSGMFTVGAAVPEPTSTLLLLGGAMFCLRRRRLR